ncbi:MAG: restriction endonuclease [Ardenticatenaceae bacterium]|nr:restriction endonuclease [Ardenticatenaceae bacterium]
MSPQIPVDAATFEQQIVHLLVKLGYGCLRRIESEEGIANFYAERETELGTDSIYVALDFWHDELVERRQVEQVVGRVAVEPARRLVVITTGRFDERAQDYARRVGVTLIKGDRIAALLQQVESGAGVTAALAAAAMPTTAEPPVPVSSPPPPSSSPASSPATSAEPPAATGGTQATPTPPTGTGMGTTPAAEPAQAAPAPEPSPPPLRRRPAGRSRPSRRPRTSRQAGGRQEQLLTIGAFIFIFLVVAVVTTLVLLLAGRGGQSTERTFAPGVAVTVEPVGSGNIVRVVGQVAPSQEVELYRNDIFVDRTTADQQGRFAFPFVPLSLEGPSTLTLRAVTREGREGDVLWQRSDLTVPFR